MATKLTDFGSIEAIISEMTLEEKARLVTGGSPFATCAIERFGIPSVRLLDGCTGVNLVQYYGDLLTRLRNQQSVRRRDRYVRHHQLRYNQADSDQA